MPCYSPLKGYRAKRINPLTGKRSIVFNPNEAFTDMPVEVACGQCIGCRLERSRQWAIRCVHEASLHEDNAFITLTYDNDHMPVDGGLHVEDFQRFMKRLRRRHPDRKIRFFHCGEYGEVCALCGNSKLFCRCDQYIKSLGRPHYHAVLFNYDFHDKKQLKRSRNGETYYISEELSQLWPQGFSIIGDVTFESAAYVARYITKKVNGDKAHGYYEKCDFGGTGEITEIRPEYTTCSRRPGIGYDWYKRFRDETYRDDFVVCRGRKVRPPRFYDKVFQEEKVDEAFRNKIVRKVNARKHSDNNTPERLRDREFCQMEKLKKLKRGIEQ